MVVLTRQRDLVILKVSSSLEHSDSAGSRDGSGEVRCPGSGAGCSQGEMPIARLLEVRGGSRPGGRGADRSSGIAARGSQPEGRSPGTADPAPAAARPGRRSPAPTAPARDLQHARGRCRPPPPAAGPRRAGPGPPQQRGLSRAGRAGAMGKKHKKHKSDKHPYEGGSRRG